MPQPNSSKFFAALCLSFFISVKAFTQSESFVGTWHVTEFDMGEQYRKFKGFYLQVFPNGVMIYQTNELDQLQPKNKDIVLWRQKIGKDNVVTFFASPVDSNQYTFKQTAGGYSLFNVNPKKGILRIERTNLSSNNRDLLSSSNLKGLWAVKLFISDSSSRNFSFTNDWYVDLFPKQQIEKEVNGSVINVRSELKENVGMDKIDMWQFRFFTYSNTGQKRLSFYTHDISQYEEHPYELYQDHIFIYLPSNGLIVLQKQNENNFFALNEVQEKHDNYLWEKLSRNNTVDNRDNIKNKPSTLELLLNVIITGLANSGNNSSSSSGRKTHYKTCPKCRGSGKSDKKAAWGGYDYCDECNGKGSYRVYDNTGEKY